MRSIIFLIFIFFSTMALSDDRVVKFKVKQIKNINNSAIMHQTKNYFLTSVTGPVGSKGIPTNIKLGDQITVEDVSISINHIFVTKYLADLEYRGEFLARKGQIRCVLVEKERDLPYNENGKSKIWIVVDNCLPL